jgi:hypothetical protein
MNFKLDLSTFVLKLRKLQLTLLEMLACVLQESIEKKHGGNPTYLAYQKKSKSKKIINFCFLAFLSTTY